MRTVVIVQVRDDKNYKVACPELKCSAETDHVLTRIDLLKGKQLKCKTCKITSFVRGIRPGERVEA